MTLLTKYFYTLIIVSIIFTVDLSAQYNKKEKINIDINSTLALPISYKDEVFQSSVPIFLTVEGKWNKFSLNTGIGAEFAKQELKNENETITLEGCPSVSAIYQGKLTRCYHYILRKSMHIRFPITVNYYFLETKKFQSSIAVGAILDYLFRDNGNTSFFVYDTDLMEIISNELEHEKFRNKYFSYANYDAVIQISGKYAFAEKWLFNMGFQYSRSFERFPLGYVNDDDKILLLTGVTFQLNKN